MNHVHSYKGNPRRIASLFVVLLVTLVSNASQGVGAPPVSKAGPASAPSQPDIILTAERTEEHRVEIIWPAKTWEKDQVGFKLVRRLVEKDGEKGQWECVGPDFHQPDFSDAWLKKNKLDRVIKQKPNLKKDRLDTQKIIDRFRKSPKELGIIDAIATNDIQWAVAFGFGWIDDSTDISKTCEYGVARVFRDGRSFKAGPVVQTVVLPEGIIRMPAPKLDSISARRARQPGLVRLQWQVSKDNMSRAGAQRFAVFRGKPAGPLTEMIGTVSPRMAEESEDHKTLTFSYADVEAGKTAHRYAVAYLDRRLKPGRLSEPVIIKELGGKLASPKGLKAELVEEGVRITWKYDDSGSGEFAGFTIHRKVGDEKKSTTLNKDLLPSGRRLFLDKLPADATGRDVTYTVWAISGDERMNTFSQSVRIHIP